MEQVDQKMVKSDTAPLDEEKKHKYIAFYGMTLPKKISQMNIDIQGQYDPNISYASSTKQKYEFQLLYLCPSPDGKKLVLRKRRICIGSQKVKDALDGTDCNILTKKSMQTKGKRIILDNDAFDVGTFIANGGFLDKRFWVYNLLWNNEDLFCNYKKILGIINSDPRLKYIDISKIQNSNKITAKKLKQTVNKKE